MKDLNQVNNPYNDDKIIDACSIFGAMDTSGRRFSCEGVIRAMANMHDRGNGLGGGFAVYGLYPEYTDLYAYHIMFLSQDGKEETESFLKENFKLEYKEEVLTRLTPAISNPPLVWRYFLDVQEDKLEGQSEDD